MPAPGAWETVLRGSLTLALSQRGAHKGWSVAPFRGRVRVNISAAAGGGQRRQILLPIPWAADQVDAIREAVLGLLEAQRSGAPLEAATVAPAPAEDEPPAAGGPINWASLVEGFKSKKISSGAVKASTWPNTYQRRMAALVEAAQGNPAPRNPRQLLEAITAPWAEQPGSRGRQIAVQQAAALLRWAVDAERLPMEWSPPLDLSPYVGRSRVDRSITTPLEVAHVLELVEAIPDPRWRYAFQLLAAYGLRPEELQHLSLRDGQLWCTYRKVSPKGATKPRALRLLPCDGWAAEWRLEQAFNADRLPPMRPGYGAEALGLYLRRRQRWQQLRREYQAAGEKLVLYSARHGYAHRAHLLCELPPKIVAAAMGHSLEAHLGHYSRWCAEDTVQVAFERAAANLDSKR
ncbi:MAG: hypothetical protein WCO50_01585 [Synechococcus sp. ELA619]